MDQVAVVRRFNRAYTQRIGVLGDSHLATGLPLAQARVLYEIGAAGSAAHGPSIRDLRDRLGFDSGHLSRLLAALVDRGLVTLRPDSDDRRRRRTGLTRQGRTTWRLLQRRSDDAAAALLAPLTPGQRARFVDAIATAELLLRAASIDFALAGPDDPQVTAAVGHYLDELARRFPGGFDATVATADIDEGTYVLAIGEGEVAGCGAVRRLGDGVAEIKRMWIDDGWRGAGLGRRLLERLETEATQRGWTEIRLDTNATLTEAVALYERAGYRPVPRYNDNPYADRWFARTLGG